MPYSKEKPPEKIKSLPNKAQDIWIAAFNAAFKEYKEDEEAANKVAWVAVKKQYKKDGDEWVLKANTITHVNGAISAKVRKEKHEGRDYLVAPAVALVEGVHAGSQGPAYYPPEELARNIQAWNGIPIPIHHPLCDDAPVSCNSPAVLDEWSVGRFFNATYENGKVKGEIWIDVEKCGRVAPEVVTALNSGKLLETSSGLWSDDDTTPGIWNGEAYDVVVRNIIPDHFALLPGGIGACSIADGCGAPRINADGGKKNMDDKEMQWLKSLLQKIGIYRLNELTDTKEVGGEDKPHTEGEKKLSSLKTAGGEKRMDERINKLIANEQTHFTEDDREWLLTLNECQLTKLEPKEAPKAEPQPKANAEPEAKKADEPKVEPEPKVNVEPKAPTFQELLAAADPDLQETINNGIAVTREQKERLVKELVANKSNVFTECELKAKKLAELKKLAALAKVEIDYAPKGGEVKINKEDDGYADDMPQVEFSKK